MYIEYLYGICIYILVLYVMKMQIKVYNKPITIDIQRT